MSLSGHFSSSRPTKCRACAGHIVGFALPRGGNSAHGLFWPSVTSAPIRITGYDGHLTPTAVNSQGVATGTRMISGGGFQTFRWSLTEGMRLLDPLGSTSSFPRAISETGYIVGSVDFGDTNGIARWNPDGAFGVVAWEGTGWQVRDDGGIVGHDYRLGAVERVEHAHISRQRVRRHRHEREGSFSRRPVVDLGGRGGETLNGAGTALRNVGLTLGTVRYVVDTSCSFIGTVMSQSPGGGAVVHWGSAVNVSVGQRPRTCP